MSYQDQCKDVHIQGRMKSAVKKLFHPLSFSTVYSQDLLTFNPFYPWLRYTFDNVWIFQIWTQSVARCLLVTQQMPSQTLLLRFGVEIYCWKEVWQVSSTELTSIYKVIKSRYLISRAG